MYKVISLSGYPLNTGYKIVHHKDGTKTTEVDKIAMPAVTGNSNTLVENSVEGVLNYLETQGWKLFNFDDDMMFVFTK